MDLERARAAVARAACDAAATSGGDWQAPAQDGINGRSRQWVYGEVLGCSALLNALVEDGSETGVKGSGEGPPRFVDIGSGSGRVCVFAAAAGIRSVGIEILEGRHASAADAKSRLASSGFADAAARLTLVCGDAFDPAVSQPHLSSAYWICCNNAVWGSALNRRLARLASPKLCPGLRALCTTRKLPPRSVARHKLRLARASAVAVSWDEGADWPLFVYVRGSDMDLGHDEDEDEDDDNEEQEMCVTTDDLYDRMMSTRADRLSDIEEPKLRLAAALELCEFSPYLHSSPHIRHLTDIFV